jgi:CheY-like chemotaxis protein
VLVVQPADHPVRSDFLGIEHTVVVDGVTACELAERERFDAVVIDLAAPPLDGWMVLAHFGGRADRPRLVALSPLGADSPRARDLGADVCISGTDALARVLDASSKEHQCQRSRVRTFPGPTTSGVSA